jgi:hypothetical protein
VQSAHGALRAANARMFATQGQRIRGNPNKMDEPAPAYL